MGTNGHVPRLILPRLVCPSARVSDPMRDPATSTARVGHQPAAEAKRHTAGAGGVPITLGPLETSMLAVLLAPAARSPRRR